MTDQHRATPEQWAETEKWALGDELDSSCILELRARIEALEAAQQDKLDQLIALDRDDPTPGADMTDHERAAINMASCPSIDRIPDFTGAAPAMNELRAASAEVRPAGGLVDRVAEGIAAADDEGLTKMTWNHHARAAIREVAAWLREGGDYSADAWADMLEREADRG